ncbi:hypothetical protein X798_03185 [Onchocerca flexuosa]|uniref:Uncharacterized protein n=1 Tax=Onchocerca flexuosa TaxID=387005 RepID=A0A238BWT5_9BILA|nr:hypothetical protein X798_03184 [Onchocerca flexuosa]OZC09782.1 hypothetical protein X798_03185 [Onchocerca flexuosa]
MFGLGPWWYNFSQFHRSELTVDNLTSVPSPYIELTIFGTFKAAEFLSFIGGCIVHPIYRLLLSRNLTPETTTSNSAKIIRNTCRKLQGRFLLASFVVGPLSTLAYVNYYSLDRKVAKELCYQIRCSEQMMVWDRTAISLGCVGWYWKRFKGAVDGVNLASVYTACYFTAQKRLINALETDKIKPWQRPKSIEEAETEKLLPFLVQTAAKDNKSFDLKASLPKRTS